MHESILKTLDSFNGPFGFGMGFEAAGQVVLFLTILSMGMAMVSCGLLSSGLLAAAPCWGPMYVFKDAKVKPAETVNSERSEL